MKGLADPGSIPGRSTDANQNMGAGMERGALIAALAELVRDLATGAVSMGDAPGRLVAIAETVSGGSGQLSLSADGASIAPPKLTEKQRMVASIQAVFEYWKKATDKPRATLTQERAAKIRARLTEGKTVKDLMQAIDGALLSEYHVSSGHLDLVTLFKNATSTEQHLDRIRGTGSQQHAESVANSDRVAELRAAMVDAKSAGNVAEYNRIRGELQNELRRK